MRQPEITISVEQDAVTVAQSLEAELLMSLASELEQSLNTSFTLSAKNSEDEMVGGLVASTSYNWLRIKILWVEESHRNSGIGQKLMEAAHTEGQVLNCHSAWLDTSSPKVYLFYSALGYEVFGQLENTENQSPPDHRRWFMKKSLGSS